MGNARLWSNAGIPLWESTKVGRPVFLNYYPPAIDHYLHRRQLDGRSARNARGDNRAKEPAFDAQEIPIARDQEIGFTAILWPGRA